MCSCSRPLPPLDTGTEVTASVVRPVEHFAQHQWRSICAIIQVWLHRQAGLASAAPRAAAPRTTNSLLIDSSRSSARRTTTSRRPKTPPRKRPDGSSCFRSDAGPDDRVRDLGRETITQAELEQGRAALLHGEPEVQVHLVEAAPQRRRHHRRLPRGLVRQRAEIRKCPRHGNLVIQRLQCFAEPRLVGQGLRGGRRRPGILGVVDRAGRGKPGHRGR